MRKKDSMNYRLGFFRVWVVVASLIVVIPTIASYDSYTRIYQQDLYLHLLPSSKNYYVTDRCSKENQWDVVLHEWQVKNTKFRFLTCEGSDPQDEATEKRLIDSTVNGKFALNIVKKYHDLRLKRIYDHWEIASWFLATWIAILVAIWYVLNGLLKPKP